jgi:hypothetical protein
MIDTLYILLLPFAIVVLIVLCGPDGWLERITRPRR